MREGEKEADPAVVDGLFAIARAIEELTRAIDRARVFRSLPIDRTKED
jgi:hypothetical protein